VVSRVVVALGGNALIHRGEQGSTEVQRRNLADAARALAELDRLGHELILTHGNGPQVGFLAIEADAARDVVPPPPLDVLVAESQGQIGYLLAEALDQRLAAEGIQRPVAVVMTRTIVNRRDPAFRRPTKPVGPVYDEGTARTLAEERGWTIAPDGAGWRRVVPSPAPSDIVEIESIRTLADAGILVIASGGGGIPVSRECLATSGIEAVVDKDRAAVVLAERVMADALLLLTDVPAVFDRWGTPDARPVSNLTLDEAAARIADGRFPPGSMGPKVAAAAEFTRATGGYAAIGSLGEAAAVLAGRAGTAIVAPGVAGAGSALSTGDRADLAGARGTSRRRHGGARAPSRQKLCRA
jgi:carbamate kinase